MTPFDVALDCECGPRVTLAATITDFRATLPPEHRTLRLTLAAIQLAERRAFGPRA